MKTVLEALLAVQSLIRKIMTFFSHFQKGFFNQDEHIKQYVK